MNKTPPNMLMKGSMLLPRVAPERVDIDSLGNLVVLLIVNHSIVLTNDEDNGETNKGSCDQHIRQGISLSHTLVVKDHASDSQDL